MTIFKACLNLMREQIGRLYDHGDHGPPSWMFDCSGLIMYVIKIIVGWIWQHSSHWQFYGNKQLPDRGTIDTMPRDKHCIVFKFGTRTNGTPGMIHVGAYDGDTKTEIQAGGRGPIVNLEVYQQNVASGMSLVDAVNNSLYKDHPGGTKKSVVWELPFIKGHWTHWARNPELDAEYTGNAPEKPTEPQEQPQGDIPATLRKGSNGAAVEKLQRLLFDAGCDLGDFGPRQDGIDGKFGNATYEAVREYQEANGLFVDGIVGPKTWGSLLADEPEQPEEPQEEPVYQWTFSATDAEAAELQDQYPNLTFTKMD